MAEWSRDRELRHTAPRNGLCAKVRITTGDNRPKALFMSSEQKTCELVPGPQRGS